MTEDRIIISSRKKTVTRGGVKQKMTEKIYAVRKKCECGRMFYAYESKPSPWCAHCLAADPQKRETLSRR